MRRMEADLLSRGMVSGLLLLDKSGKRLHGSGKFSHTRDDPSTSCFVGLFDEFDPLLEPAERGAASSSLPMCYTNGFEMLGIHFTVVFKHFDKIVCMSVSRDALVVHLLSFGFLISFSERTAGMNSPLVLQRLLEALRTFCQLLR